jgi:hypothetical protein
MKIEILGISFASFSLAYNHRGWSGILTSTMNAHELVELAAIVSAHGPGLVKAVDRIPENGLEQYWTASKVRLDRWCHAIRNFSTLAEDPKWRQSHWPKMRIILEEVITGEMLTRVWTAVLCAHDRTHRQGEAEPIARSVLLGHLEARHRVLTLLLNTPGLEVKTAAKLNWLYNLSERWTDLLVGYLYGLGDLSEFAIEHDRAKDFSRDLRQEGVHPGRRIVWPLILSSLRACFRQELTAESPNADVNLRIGAGIIGCFPSDLFDSTGQFQSLWLVRLNNSASDAQILLGELLDSPPHRQSSPFSHDRPKNRLR